MKSVDLVIVGGGIFGCAIAYYYTRNYPAKSVMVLERKELCNAATSRAAALMTVVRSKQSYIPLSLETRAVIPELEKQLGESLDMKTVGMMHVAASEAREKDLQELMAIAGTYEQPAEWLRADEAMQKAPWLKADEARAIAFLPQEAYCDPYLLGTFFARCAKQQGADIRQGVGVQSMLMEGNTVVGLQTDGGKLYAGKVVIAAGAWSPLLARQAGIGLPMAPVRSQYWITERSSLFPEASPIVLLPDAQAYARPEGGALLFGVRENRSLSLSPDLIPEEITEFSFSPDRGMTDLSEVIERLGRFFPGIYDIGLKYYMAGFSAYTPDGNLSMGVAPGVNNLLLATGCVGAGIAIAGGVGRAFAELAAGRSNPYNFNDFDISRFGKIDPFSQEWLDKCAMARSKKVSG
ncbi:NAD(P)/FAD-dependent oxidoreductase [Flavihumibacter petaseus]|uniref:Putative oxidoreductase n=1 Tax=Flavihumibacter petaseus NBRC 106054 TaxID=1220578 RepID=A0A0E9N3S0_9BACT|nr:FAD-binding oxidoreductase [Flavihumibacter petaseus]GAO44627.1 putative oxidoreductase [Flavihumibacter petaseus NBRC 106054]